MAKKIWKRHDIFQSAIYYSIDSFEYVPENNKTIEAFYWRYEDIFNVDCKQWPSKKKVMSTIRKNGNNRT